MKILTVTPNAAIDETVTIGRLVPGEVHRASSVRFTAGGKGVNVASCLADWGIAATATGFIGEENAAVFEQLCHEKRIEDRFIRVPGATRVNIKLVDAAGTTDINVPGMTVSPRDIALCATAIGGSGDHPVAVLAGSLPTGCPEHFYTGFVEELAARGCKVILDTAGPALQAALSAKVLPFCVKPNRAELAEWFGHDLTDIDAVTRGAKKLLDAGIKLVAVSLGDEGALFLSAEGCLIARARAGKVESTTGAGDAMVAGIVAGLMENAPLERLARLATAFAVAKLGLPGPNLPEKEAVEALAQNVSVGWRVLS